MKDDDFKLLKGFCDRRTNGHLHAVSFWFFLIWDSLYNKFVKKVLFSFQNDKLSS